jgi:hypothetical protein
LFYWTVRQFVAAPGRTVRLGEYPDNLMCGIEQSAEMARREIRRTGKYDT